MKYIVQKGVVRETICGQSLLISTKEAREYCPYLTQLNESSVFIWKMLEKGKSTDEMIQEIMHIYGITENEADEGLTEFLNVMEGNHFITKEV